MPRGQRALEGQVEQDTLGAFRGWMRELFTRLAADPDALGDQLQISTTAPATPP
ncbi:hypothetical protein AB0958_43845 [Streptomyces sp. NPDC006655]|uniref:hypothetical protein n=1 Tax=Streptomyces sp. NPDC006655 TaxID=3156898 RepID=UPI003452EDED